MKKAMAIGHRLCVSSHSSAGVFSVSRQGWIDPYRPLIDTTHKVLHFLEPHLFQEPHGPGAAGAMVAVHNDVP
jgi:hypothetical protein